MRFAAEPWRARQAGIVCGSKVASKASFQRAATLPRRLAESQLQDVAQRSAQQTLQPILYDSPACRTNCVPGEAARVRATDRYRWGAVGHAWHHPGHSPDVSLSESGRPFKRSSQWRWMKSKQRGHFTKQPAFRMRRVFGRFVDCKPHTTRPTNEGSSALRCASLPGALDKSWQENTCLGSRSG